MAGGDRSRGLAPRRRRAITLGLAVAGLVVAVGATGWWIATRPPEPVTVEEATRRFRQERAGTTVAPPMTVTTTVTPSTAAPTGFGGGLPAEGVYRYATTGSESLAGPVTQTHDYPAETAVTVRRQGCGVTLEWRPLDVRADTWQWCPVPAGLATTGVVQEHGFFGLRDERTYACDPAGLLLPAQATPGATWSDGCRSSDTDTTRTGRVVGPEPVSVGDRTVGTIRVEVVEQVRGASEGTVTYGYWLRPADGLLVRFTQTVDSASPSPVGRVTYREAFTLTLVALEPVDS